MTCIEISPKFDPANDLMLQLLLQLEQNWVFMSLYPQEKLMIEINHASEIALGFFLHDFYFLMHFER